MTLRHTYQDKERLKRVFEGMRLEDAVWCALGAVKPLRGVVERLDAHTSPFTLALKQLDRYARRVERVFSDTARAHVAMLKETAVNVRKDNAEDREAVGMIFTASQVMRSLYEHNSAELLASAVYNAARVRNPFNVDRQDEFLEDWCVRFGLDIDGYKGPFYNIDEERVEYDI